MKNPDLNIQRVYERVTSGGHFVPDEDVRRRYERSLSNAAPAIKLADLAVLFDNSGNHHRKVAEIANGRVIWQAPDLPEWARRVVADLE